MAKKYRWGLLLAGAILVTPVFLYEWPGWPLAWVFPLIYCGAGSLLIGALGFEPNPKGYVSLLAHIGFCSYSIYLWHFAMLGVAQMGVTLIPASGWLQTGLHSVLYWFLSVSMGLASTHWVERFVLNWRDRVVPANG